MLTAMLDLVGGRREVGSLELSFLKSVLGTSMRSPKGTFLNTVKKFLNLTCLISKGQC